MAATDMNHANTPALGREDRRSSSNTLSGRAPSSGAEKGQSPDLERNSAQPASTEPELEYRAHGLRDPEVRALLKGVLKGMVPMIIILSTVVIWGMLPLYWGSLYKLTTRRLPAWIVNGDPTGAVGRTIEDGILSSVNPSNSRRMKWISKPFDQYPTEAIEHHVVRDFDAWIVVQIAENATARLQEAVASGDSTWDPSKVVQIYTTTSRNFNAAPASIVQPTQMMLEMILTKLSPQIVLQWLAQIQQSPQAVQSALLSAAAAAPQTLSNPIWYSIHDLRPFDQSVTVATTFVGLIYQVIVTFNISMAFFQLRQKMQVYLKPKSLVWMRLLIPIITYVPISLLYSMVNLPFKVHFSRLGPNNAAGFFAFWATTFVGFLVLGFLTDILLTMLTPQLAVLGLVLVICTGVAGCNYPIEMLNVFYKWEYAMPFYNLKAIYTTIIFDVGKQVHILMHMGILWAWLFVLFVTLPIWVCHEQRAALKLRGVKLTKPWPIPR